MCVKKCKNPQDVVKSTRSHFFYNKTLCIIPGYGIKYNCLLSVFAGDGTISVTHSGIEMGQGINTKVGLQAVDITNCD